MESKVTLPVWLFAAAVTCVQAGGTWDISWHLSIGRDEFLTPPHVLIYLGGILAGLASALLILGRRQAAGVGILFWRAPLGAFLAAWGGMAMLVSAPFDDWWHSAYGLDVKILSPPHVVLLLGVLAVELGALLVILGEFNRAGSVRPHRALQWIFLFIGSLAARSVAGSLLELMTRNFMHTARYYIVWSIIIGWTVGAVATASRHRWGATIVTAILMSMAVLSVWVLPLFPAEPKLGPVFQQVTHLIPPAGFPALILIPGVVLDLIRQRVSGTWKTALAAGPLMLLSFMAVQWPFADFLLSPAARNAFFGSHYFPYFLPPGTDLAHYVHTQMETSGQFWLRMALAPVVSVLFLRLGLGLGGWMQTIRR